MDSTRPGTTSLSSVNLPLPLLPRFTSEDLTQIFGTCLPDGAFLVDPRDGALLAVNQRLVQLLGRDVAGLDPSELTLSRHVDEEDRERFERWLEEEEEGVRRIETKLIDAAGFLMPVEISLTHVRWRGQAYALGYVKDGRSVHEREARLQRQVTTQKDRVFRALRSSLRVYELNEKIKSTLLLTTALLNAESESDLYEEAVQVLTSAEGLNFRDVTLYLADSDRLEVVRTTRADRPAEGVDLEGESKFARCVREDSALKSEEGPDGQREFLVPLRAGGSLIGLLEAVQYSHEKVFFEEFRLLEEWQRETLIQVGDIIALNLENIRLNRELRHQSITDSLTGTYNRDFFIGRLDSEICRSRRYGRPLSLIFIDVDHFKQVNDAHGHLVGDQVLRELTDLFRAVLRESDVLCRYGGDEFVILLPEADEAKGRLTAQKIRDTVRQHRFSAGGPDRAEIAMTVSLGVSTLIESDDPESFLRAADEAVYRAKREGRDALSTSNDAAPPVTKTP